MNSTLAVGLSRTEKVEIDEDRTISFLGEANRVYSTPSMISDIEYACWRLLAEHLEDGENSVGTRVAVDHLAPTPLGEVVEVRVRIDRVDGRKVSFEVQVHDRLECAGRGVHERVVIDVDRHGARLLEKAERLLRSI